jgi:hypothetical protein
LGAMQKIVLYCKSYNRDFNRLLRLARSIQDHNSDRIPFYVSVPDEDHALFLASAFQYGFVLIKDEDIVSCNKQIDIQHFRTLPGYLQQQIVKSEFWRLKTAANYLCIDSDSEFLRDFYTTDFISSEGHPYSVIHEEHGLLEELIARDKTDKLESYFHEAAKLQKELSRTGRLYSYGPTPVVWSAAVWSDLDENYFKPHGMTILDAIVAIPSELRWYGEAMLKYKSVPLMPIEPLFKVLHYHWQNSRWLRKMIKSPYFNKLYMGVIYQSNWDASMDWPKERGNWLSRLGRRLKQMLF